MAPKLCECGCGAEAPIAKRTHTRKGHVKGQPVRFINGHGFRGRTRPPETRRKMSLAMVGNTNGSGPRSTSSRDRRTIHAWLNRWYPKTGICEECGEKSRDYAFLHHPLPHTRNRDDYKELCRRCHMTLDNRFPIGRVRAA